MLHVAKPYIGEEEINAVIEVLKSGMIAQGPKVAAFEEAFAASCGATYGIAVNSGTAALHAALYAAGVGPGDEVITTPFTFVATANTILQQGAIPVFCDIDPITFNIDPASIEKHITEKTKAIIPVDIFGLPYDVDAINAIAKKHDLKIVEDACQAHGATCGGKKAGTFGDVGCFSLYATKNITTAEGGMIVTDDPKLAELAKQFRHHGQSQTVRYYYADMGYNYRMTDINAAIGIEQLKRLDGFNIKRKEHAAILTAGLAEVKGITTPTAPDEYDHVYHQYTIRVTDDFSMSRDELCAYLREHEIGSAVFYPHPLHLSDHMKMAKGHGTQLPHAEKAAAEVLSLPVHPGLTEADMNHIVHTITSI